MKVKIISRNPTQENIQTNKNGRAIARPTLNLKPGLERGEVAFSGSGFIRGGLLFYI